MTRQYWLIPVVFLAWTGGAMAQIKTSIGLSEETLLLDASPPPNKDSLITKDIVSTQQVLGGDTAKAIKVQEGQVVTRGTPLVYPQVNNPLAVNGVNPIAPGKCYYLIRFDFTLYPLKERHIKSIIFGVRLDTADSVAFMLIPAHITTSEDVKELEELGLSFSASPVGGPTIGAAGKIIRSVSSIRLKPLITAYGGGAPNFSWKFQGVGNDPVEEGWKTVAAVVQAPTNAKTLKVTFSYEVELARRFFDAFRDVPVTVQDETRDLPLQ